MRRHRTLDDALVGARATPSLLSSCCGGSNGAAKCWCGPAWQHWLIVVGTYQILDFVTALRPVIEVPITPIPRALFEEFLWAFL